MSSSNNDNSANNANAQGLEAETRENASTGIPTQQYMTSRTTEIRKQGI